MSRVGAWELVSLDGVMERPEEWAFSYSDHAMGEASASGMAASDALLLGGVTYEHLAAYWPNQPDGEPMVDYLNGVPKYAVSGTLEEPLRWNNSTIIGGNVAEEIARLKRQPGKGITILGNGRIAPGGVRARIQVPGFRNGDRVSGRLPEVTGHDMEIRPLRPLQRVAEGLTFRSPRW